MNTTREKKHILAINGSPRKNGNTATLLQNILKGAAAEGADTELVHLYDLNFKGCTSCFACKLVGGPSEGQCAMRDDLTPVLRTIETKATALALGTPIYFAAMTGEARSFVERILFPPLVYSNPPHSRFPRKIRTGLVYTMNATEEMVGQRGYASTFRATEASFRMMLGAAESLLCYDTLQFQDHSKVVMEYFDPAKKIERRKTVFPEDCRIAFELGRRLAADAPSATPG